MKWGLIVEGQGDESAAPVVLRRVITRFVPGRRVGDVETMRVSRAKFAKEAEVRRAVELVARRAGPRAPVG